MQQVINEQQFQPITFDAIKIGLASPEKIMNGPEARLKTRDH